MQANNVSSDKASCTHSHDWRTSMQGYNELLLHADTKAQPMGYKPALSFKGYAPDNGRPSIPDQACLPIKTRSLLICKQMLLACTNLGRQDIEQHS